MKSLNKIILKKISLLSTPKKFFTDCGKSQCGCKGAAEPDEFEKKMKSLNYKIIQCINLGKYENALDLSNDYIKQLKDNYGTYLLIQAMSIRFIALLLITKLLY
jgi:hypothetical protein